MSKINLNNFDFDDIDDDAYDNLYEEDRKDPPKFKDEYSKDNKKKVKIKRIKKNNEILE